jgi:predicted nuclease of restriction endonuclease-like RecB superfamily
MKKLIGTRVLLSKPVKPETTIVMSPEMEDEMEREMMKKWTHLEVYAVGSDVTSVNVGDSVYVPSFSLQSADLIELDDLSTKLMIAERDIAIIW